MKKIIGIAVLTIVTLVVLGAAGFAYAQAQDPPVPPDASDHITTWGQMGARGRLGMMSGMRQAVTAIGKMGFQRGFAKGWGRGHAAGMFGPMHEYMVEALAGKLGISAEELQTRLDNGETPWQVAQAHGLTDEQIHEIFEQAHAEALQAAVAAGVLTQEQADAMNQHMEQMWTGAMGGMMRGRFGAQQLQEPGPLHEYKIQALAAALGLPVDQVETRLEAGERMIEIAEAQGLSVEEFRIKMLEASKDAINQALAAGDLTQEQADWMLERLEGSGASGFVPGSMHRGGFGRGGCPGMGGGRWSDQP